MKTATTLTAKDYGNAKTCQVNIKMDFEGLTRDEALTEKKKLQDKIFSLLLERCWSTNIKVK